MLNQKVKEIAEILAKFDVEGLIESGAPNDEYLPEAKAIEKFIKENGFTGLKTEIKHIFLEFLECELDDKILKNIEENIKEKLLKIKGE